MKNSPQGKTLNPKTNRYVNIDGKIGTTLRTTTSPKYLNHDILNIIAEKANSATQKTLQKVNKHFKETIIVDLAFGRKNTEFLMNYLKKESDYNLIIAAMPVKDSGKVLKYQKSITIKSKYYEDKKITKIVFYLNTLNKINYSETSEIIGIFQYKNKKELDTLKLSKVINKSKHKILSDILNNMNYLYDTHTNQNDSMFKEWKNYVTLPKQI